MHHSSNRTASLGPTAEVLMAQCKKQAHKHTIVAQCGEAQSRGASPESKADA